MKGYGPALALKGRCRDTPHRQIKSSCVLPPPLKAGLLRIVRGDNFARHVRH